MSGCSGHDFVNQGSIGARIAISFRLNEYQATIPFGACDNVDDRSMPFGVVQK